MRISAALLLVLATTSAASAELPPGPVTMGEAGHIAREAGVAEIKEIDLDDGMWEIDGFDREGREVELEIDAATGDLVRAKRD